MTPGSVDRGLDSLRQRAGWARALLLAFMVFSVASLVLAIAFWLLPAGNALQLDRNMAVLRVLGPLAGIATLANAAITIGCALTISLWIWRAHANLRQLGLSELNYSPGWAVGSMFVPVIGLIIPFGAMRELYNRSSGEPAHFAAVSVSEVGSWWTCYVVGNLIQNFVIFTLLLGPMTGIHVITPPMVNQGLMTFALLLLLGAAFFLRRIIAAITGAQHVTTGIGETFA